MSLPYQKDNVQRANGLRKNATPQERKLWFQYLRTYPVRFQRQKCIDRYIVDFYCHRAKLVIELDGSGHYSAEGERHDRIRTDGLEQYGLSVLRFTNTEVEKNFAGVCQRIDETVRSVLGDSAAERKTGKHPAL